jgi:hypothetical protein
VLESGTMFWKPFQFLIMSALVISNAIWHWTPNGLAAGVVGAGLAYVVTLVIVKLYDGVRKKRPPLASMAVGTNVSKQCSPDWL